MTGPQALARLARDTVDGADRARLAIHGCSLGPDNPVATLYTDNGWPVFWCDLNSTTAAAAAEKRTAMLIVSGPAAGPETVTVLLAGRLELIGTGRRRGRPIGAVTLTVERVQVETRAPGHPAVTRTVPLATTPTRPRWPAGRRSLRPTPTTRTPASCAIWPPPRPGSRPTRSPPPG